MFSNQSFKQTIKYRKNSDEDSLISVNIHINTNHEMSKDFLAEIEKALNNMFVGEYVREEVLIAKQIELKEQEKQQKQQEKEILKNQKEQQKQNEKLLKDIQKKQVEQQKFHLSKIKQIRKKS